MIDNRLYELLGQHLGEGKRLSSGDVMYSSPFKAHRKRKLSVCLDRDRKEFGWWNCWITDESGKSLHTLMRRAGIPGASQEIERITGQRWRMPVERADAEREEPDITLPDAYRPLNRYSNDWAYEGALEYIRARGFGLAEIARYDIGYCAEGRYAGRVIVPSYDEEGALNYFVARDYHWDSDIKYLNPRAPRDTVVFGSAVYWDHPVTLVEGVFDAIAARRNALPLLGKTLPSALRERLVERRPPRVVIALDGDAMEAAASICEDLLGTGLSVSVVWLEDGDPADMGFEAFRRAVDGAEDVALNDTEAIVRMRLA